MTYVFRLFLGYSTLLYPSELLHLCSGQSYLNPVACRPVNSGGFPSILLRPICG